MVSLPLDPVHCNSILPDSCYFVCSFKLVYGPRSDRARVSLILLLYRLNVNVACGVFTLYFSYFVYFESLFYDFTFSPTVSTVCCVPVFGIGIRAIQIPCGLILCITSLCSDSTVCSSFSP